jgi:hypothetical protein
MKCLGGATIKIVIVICVDYIKLLNDFQADISITCPSFIATSNILEGLLQHHKME